MRYLLIVLFSLVAVSCVKKQKDVGTVGVKKGENTKGQVLGNKRIKELESQVYHLMLHENKYCYFLGKKGDYQNITLNFNVKSLISDATIDNIFYDNEFNPFRNQLYRIKNYKVESSSNYEIAVFDEFEGKDARINFGLINKKDDVWKFEFLPSWKEEESKRDYLANLDLRQKYLFVNKKSIDSITVLTKGVWSEDDNDENLDTVCYKMPYYFKLKEKYKHWKNYNPIRFVSSKNKVAMYTSPDVSSEVVENLKYNDWVIINDTVEKGSTGNNSWLDVYDRVNFRKGYILNKDLAEKPTYKNLLIK
ncbi:hypothetical protein [Flavobacterium tructae]|uniref:Lipoprotein n=1 Tax=Flavobacterium tructae TaxID=1114873 RepID=A0A1S1J9K7_9FLAO|nr:hypothetical protein [Flavobacterium tructae]OHT44983.1 hypothetical protein BHE19_09720 [Flavobacterium tructae]OXB16666.1 hypothetical protein B0A71_19580 [Flavobacterium tructae]OXB25095.1 hypothetical protein B0A80_02370 [Flavobacterium tructae]